MIPVPPCASSRSPFSVQTPCDVAVGHLLDEETYEKLEAAMVIDTLVFSPGNLINL